MNSKKYFALLAVATMALSSVQVSYAGGRRAAAKRASTRAEARALPADATSDSEGEVEMRPVADGNRASRTFNVPPLEADLLSPRSEKQLTEVLQFVTTKVGINALRAALAQHGLKGQVIDAQLEVHRQAIRAQQTTFVKVVHKFMGDDQDANHALIAALAKQLQPGWSAYFDMSKLPILGDPRDMSRREAAMVAAGLVSTAVFGYVGLKYGSPIGARMKGMVTRITFGDVKQYTRDQWIDLLFTPAQLVRHPGYAWEIATEKPVTTGLSLALLGAAAYKVLPPVYGAVKSGLGAGQSARDFGGRQYNRAAGAARRAGNRASGVFVRTPSTQTQSLASDNESSGEDSLG